MSNDFPKRKIQSFVKRNSRITSAQRKALAEGWPQFGLPFAKAKIDLAQVFSRKSPCILEIGFGSGQSLLAMAKEKSDFDFIGVETYLPGIAALLLGMRLQELSNIRIFHADAVEVLTHCIPPASLDGVQIFFPDPWPKRRHHKRRLIQTAFVNLLVSRLKVGGILHLATDWQDYAEHMIQVLSAIPELINVVGSGQFATRSEHRPIITKFEGRGLHKGHLISELQFKRSG
jgi:tRNA (guanine-N7-)-methyltransferase